MQANLFAVSVEDGTPVITRGIPVLRKESWVVPLGECFNCGADTFLPCSTTNAPMVTVEETDPKKGRIYNASVMECSVRSGEKPLKKLRKPDQHAGTLKCFVMLMHYDELKLAEGTYEVIREGTGVLIEMYRGTAVNFRCPQGIDTYSLSYDGTNLACVRLTLDGQPDAEPVVVGS